MKDDLFQGIIIKFLHGDATPHEKTMLSNWLKDDPEGEEFFYYYLSKHESESPQYLPVVDAKLEAYEKFLRGEITLPTADLPSYDRDDVGNSRSMRCRWSWAACIIVLVSASFYLLNDILFYKTYTAQNAMIQSVTLPDGSAVTLNANSSIRIHRDFMGHENREVWIKGEAFFEVAKKNDRMKFIVHTDNFDVEVLGTKFNVNNRRGKTEVMLEEGKVKLVAKDQKPLIMQPGEQVSLSNSENHFTRQVAKAGKYEAWRKNMLVFENTPLTEVANIIKDHYGVEMIVSDSLLGSRQFTGTLPNNDLDVILLVLKTSYNIEIRQKGDYLLLTK